MDDLFVQRAFRGIGLGSAALAEVRSFCTSQGVRALHVETGRDNAPAMAVYRRAGFVDTDRVHLTLGLADPTHVTGIIDVLDDDALPGKPKCSLRKPLEEAVTSFERGDTRRALHELRVFLRKTKTQPPSPDPVRAAGVRQLTQVLIDTVREN